MENERFSGAVWECACGDGAMADVISRYAPKVHSSDLYDHGFGETGVDFLKAKSRASNIITNPPFHSAEGFVHSALQKADQKFAFLLRLAFLEGANRANTIFHVAPPSRVWVFSERVTFYAKGAKRSRAQAQRHTHGLSGTESRVTLSFTGLSLATRKLLMEMTRG